jgi:hypothetical protein
MKTTVCARKLNTTEEMLRQILNAARRINNAAASWSHGPENVPKQMAAILNNLHEQ